MQSAHNPSNHHNHWQETKRRLQERMTKATFNTWLAQTQAISNANGHYQIAVQSDRAADWLQHRLHHLIKSTLQSVDPAAEALEFVVQAQAAAEPKPTRALEPKPEPPQEPQPQEQPPIATDLASVNYPRLWVSSGFLQVSHYAAQFWRLYLGDKAFSLWTVLQAKPIQKADRENGWTPVEREYYRKLARLSSAGASTIRGGLEDCNTLRDSIKFGSPLTECCQKPIYQPCIWSGDGHCKHWRTGLLEILYAESLVAIEERKSEHSRGHRLRIQTWRWLPILTPHQVGQLNETDQDNHTRWIERYGHLAEPQISLDAWERETRHSLVPSLDDGSRLLFEPFCPSPFAPNGAKGSSD